MAKKPQFSTYVSDKLKEKLDNIAATDGLTQKQMLAEYVKLWDEAQLCAALPSRADEIRNFKSLLAQISAAYDNALNLYINQEKVIKAETAAKIAVLSERCAVLEAERDAAIKEARQAAEKIRTADAVISENAALKDQINTLKDQVVMLRERNEDIKNKIALMMNSDGTVSGETQERSATTLADCREIESATQAADAPQAESAAEIQAVSTT